MMLNCREATFLMSAAQDRPLGIRERWALRIHVMACSGCRNASRQFRFLRRAARLYVAGAPEAKTRSPGNSGPSEGGH
jgi:hypothetical protein